MKSLLKYLGKAKLFIAIALIIKVSAPLIELAIPYILSHILDNVVPTKSIKTIVFYGIAMIACACLACVGNITANRMAARVARNTTKELRHDLFVRTMGLSSKQIDKYTIPSLESRLTSDTYHVHHFVGMSRRMGVRAPILLVGGLFVTATLDPILTLVMALILPFITFTIYFIRQRGTFGTTNGYPDIRRIRSLSTALTQMLTSP